MRSIKDSVQSLIRMFNIFFFKKDMPKKISIYFHETGNKEIKEIVNVINFYSYLGYEFVTISELNQRLNDNSNLIAITFDDGFKNWADLIPVFNKYNVKGTFYLNSIQFTDESLEQYLIDINFKSLEDLISESDLMRLYSEGHEIGAHTHTHKTLSRIEYNQFLTEINRNLEFFKQKKINVKSFAIPYGMRRYVKSRQLNYLISTFDTVCFGEPGMLFNQKNNLIQRTPWKINKSFIYNIYNICTNTSIFNQLTKRSGVG